MGWFDTPTEKAAAAKGRDDAKADRRAGGPGRGWNGSRTRQQTTREVRAYDRAYKKAAPRGWFG